MRQRAGEPSDLGVLVHQLLDRGVGLAGGHKKILTAKDAKERERGFLNANDANQREGETSGLSQHNLGVPLSSLLAV